MTSRRPVPSAPPASARRPVQLRGVSKRYGATTAVAPSSTSMFRPPRCFALLGPNGAGKTTTVEMCEGFLKPDAGSIRILGLDPVADNAQLRARIGVMLQGGGAYPAARAGEMLDLVAVLRRRSAGPAVAAGHARADRRRPHHLPAALRRPAAAARAGLRAWSGRPELVFLDEPTAGMDAHARIVVWELIDASAPRRRDGGADHPPARGGRGTGRPDSDHRPRRGRRRRAPRPS